MLQYGGAPSPELPHVPFARDLTTSPEDRQLLDLSTGPLKIAYPYLMGPGVPLDRLAAIRSGFMKVFNDPALRAEALKQTLDIDPVSAEEVQSLIKATYDAPKAVQERLRNLYQAQVR